MEALWTVRKEAIPLFRFYLFSWVDHWLQLTRRLSFPQNQLHKFPQRFLKVGREWRVTEHFTRLRLTHLLAGVVYQAL